MADRRQSNCVICGKNALPDGLRCCSVECGQIAEEQEAQMESLNDDEIPF
jgi:predicted nucleic acid-binding Zn ribbon protein